MDTTFLNASKPMSGFRNKAETFLEKRFESMIGSGHFKGIHLGRNKDAASVGANPGFKIVGTKSLMASAIYFKQPDRMMGDSILADEVAKKKSIVTRASDAIKAYAIEAVADLMEKGIEKKEAQRRVADSVSKYGFFDPKMNAYVEELVRNNRTKDSILGGLATPYWNISPIQKIFRQPFLRGYSDLLVNPIGVPNAWADLIAVYTESFEGRARLSTVAKGMPEFNTSTAVKNRTGIMLSEVVNLVIDYETPDPAHEIIGGMSGNWLTNATIGDRDQYGNLMLRQLATALDYFGDPESGFEGLVQIANRDGTYEFYDAAKPPANVIWNGTSTTPGADLLDIFLHKLGDWLEELFFLAVDIRITCAPVLYKVLKFSMLSKQFNQNSPLSIIATAQEAENKMVGTMVTKSGQALYRSFELIADPMLAPGTEFNATNEDLMFVVFPTLQSAMDPSGLDDLVMAPMPIESMILPSAPGYRDGMVRTQLMRKGSIIAPVAGTVHVISGMGTNTRYTPPST